MKRGTYQLPNVKNLSGAHSFVQRRRGLPKKRVNQLQCIKDNVVVMRRSQNPGSLLGRGFCVFCLFVGYPFLGAVLRETKGTTPFLGSLRKDTPTCNI